MPSPPGRWSVIVTPFAVAGPALLAVMVNPIGDPALTLSASAVLLNVSPAHCTVVLAGPRRVNGSEWQPRFKSEAAAADRLATSWTPAPFTAWPLHRRLSLCTWPAVLAGLTVLMLAAAVDGARHHDMSALVFALIVGPITVILPGSIMFARSFCYVAADDSGVTVRRIIPTYLIPWSAIQDVASFPAHMPKQRYLSTQAARC
jgi:hypothetical protein